MHAKKPDLRVKPSKLKFILLIGGFFTIVCVPIIIKPYFDSGYYRKVQEKMRAQYGKTREELQPGGLRPWSDPFKELPAKEDK